MTGDPVGELFTNRIVGMMNAGMVAAMMGLGLARGWFWKLSAMSPCTAESLAIASDEDPALLAAWLDSMAAGHLLDFDGRTSRYSIPPAHLKALVANAHHIEELAELLGGAVRLAERRGRADPDASRNPGACESQAEPAEDPVRQLVELFGLCEWLEAGASRAIVVAPEPHTARAWARRFPRCTVLSEVTAEPVDLVVLVDLALGGRPWQDDLASFVPCLGPRGRLVWLDGFSPDGPGPKARAPLAPVLFALRAAGCSLPRLEEVRRALHELGVFVANVAVIGGANLRSAVLAEGSRAG